MLPSEVNNTRVKDSFEYDKMGNATAIKVYTFFIGEHGPFTEKFYSGEQDTPAVERRIAADVQRLREQGLLPQK
jgi:hypothetical protein